MDGSDAQAALEALLTPEELDLLARAELLPNRERAVFVLLGQGHRPKSIAYELAISATTVETHIGRVRAKLGGEQPLELADLVFLARLWVRAHGV